MHKIVLQQSENIMQIGAVSCRGISVSHKTNRIRLILANCMAARDFQRAMGVNI